MSAAKGVSAARQLRSKGHTENRTYIIHCTSEKRLQGLHASHAPSPSTSISQQQKSWLSHQLPVQYPFLRSESHSVTMDIKAALTPMQIPK
jgi:hypothetical protein